MRHIDSREEGVRQGERGSALIVALALVLALTVLVAATQWQVIHDLKLSKTERDYERALQMAESGANAYLNMLAHRAAPGNPLIPQPYTMGTVLTPQEFKQQAKNGTIPAASLVHYPTGQTRQGYFAAHLGAIGNEAEIVSYGWSNGVVRRLRVHARVKNIFDWAALWGLNPSLAWTVSGGASIVGAAGGEGPMKYGNNNVFYDGPLLLCTSNARWRDANGNDIAPPPTQSYPNIPTGHVGTGEIADPWVKRYNRPLGFPTADEAANEWAFDRYGATTTAGVEYFRSTNDNGTGLRYLVKNWGPDGVFGTADDFIRELPGSYSPANDSNDYVLSWPSDETLATLGKVETEEVAFGIRIYPGTYYFTSIDMRPSDYLYLRTYNDSDRTDTEVTAARPFVVVGDPANPNPGMADERNIRAFIGHRRNGSDRDSRFEKGTSMEYPRWASRFRIFSATQGDILVRGSNSGPPMPFNVNLLAYNRTATGQGYGTVKFTSAVYLLGSLLSWYVDVSGGTTLEKQVPELAPNDPLAYLMQDWRELE